MLTNSTPTSTPTILPSSHLENANQAIFFGDWETALHEFQTALQEDPKPEIQNATLLGIGKTYYLAGNYTEAHNTLLDLITNFPAPNQLPTAYIYLALSNSALGNYQEEANQIQELYKGEMLIYEAEADIYQAKMEAYQETYTSWEVARTSSVGGAEGLIESITDEFGWAWVNKEDSGEFFSWMIKAWVAQLTIIMVFIGLILILIKRKDVN